VAQQYRLERVEVEANGKRPATWSFAGASVRGTEHRYIVTDRNHRSRNQWEFVVRVPNDPYGRIEVRPTNVPNDQAFAELDRRALTFMRGTRPNYTSFRYYQLSLAVPGGTATRDIVHRGEKASLPSWLRKLGWRLRQKQTVRITHGTDGRSFVVLLQPHDHKMMIRLFLATKAWILKRNVSLAA
jgi:hypothetical protein